MLAINLISKDIPPVKTSDTGTVVLDLMANYYVRHLPIVNNKDFLGLISEEEIYNYDEEEAIGSYRLSMARPFCYEHEHIFEVMQKMSTYHLTIVPVLNREGHYVGMVTMEDMLHYYASSYAFREPGSILVLETSRSNYSLGEIARIAESENVTILSSFLTLNPNSQHLHVTLKVNTTDLSHLVATFQRFEYNVSGSYSEEEYIDTLKERYDGLMAYLNV